MSALGGRSVFYVCLAVPGAVSNTGGRRRDGRGVLSRGSVMRVTETLSLLLAAVVLFMWAVLAHSTPQERARLHDSMGASTGIAWR